MQKDPTDVLVNIADLISFILVTPAFLGLKNMQMYLDNANSYLMSFAKDRDKTDKLMYLCAATVFLYVFTGMIFYFLNLSYLVKYTAYVTVFTVFFLIIGIPFIGLGINSLKSLENDHGFERGMLIAGGFIFVLARLVAISNWFLEG